MWPEAGRCGRQHLPLPRVRPACCARPWSGPTCKRPSACTATTAFLRELGGLLHLDPEPFIEREKHTTLKPVWDLWRSVTQDFFGTAAFRHRGGRDLCPRRAPLPRRRAGTALQFRGLAASPGEKTDNAGVRALVHEKAPLVMFGSFNERMYLAEAGAAKRAHAAGVDRGLLSRRHHPPRDRHALHGLCRRDLSCCRSSATRCSTRSSTSCRWAPNSTAWRRHPPALARAGAVLECRGQGTCWTSCWTPIPCWCASRPPSACATALKPRRAQRGAADGGGRRHLEGQTPATGGFPAALGALS